MSNSISEKVLERIKAGQVKPKPCWRFTLERWAVIVLVVIFLLIGSLSVGLIMEIVNDIEIMNIWTKVKDSLIVLQSLPYIWMILLVSSLLLVSAEFLRTKYGYKYRLRNVVLTFLGAIIILGWGSFSLGWAEKTENYLENKFPQYHLVLKTPRSFWLQPEHGLISGIIISTDSGAKVFQLEDLRRQDWEVDYREAVLDKKVNIMVGEGVRIIGDRESLGKFKAKEIRPWTKCKRCKSPGSIKKVNMGGWEWE